MSHPEPPVKLPVGLPQLLGFGLAELMSLGALPRAKYQMLICELVHSIA